MPDQLIDAAALVALDELVLGPQYKGLPQLAWGKTVRAYLDTGPALDQLPTPLLTIDQGALRSNLAVMTEWARSAGVLLAPHGKTTMAPQLWARQLAAGAWGITLATPWQVQLARSFGLARILLANAIVDPVALHWLAGELRADPRFEFYSWADSVETVELMDRALTSAEPSRPVNVMVELGGPGGRTGVRSSEPARAVAAAIHRSPRLALAGVGGYEGALGHGRGPADLSAVRRYLDRVGRLHERITADGLYGPEAIVTAGGSAYHDIVAGQLAFLAGNRNGVRTSVMVRPGAYLLHDDGYYAGISPLSPGRAEHPLRPAIHGWARAISRPEPELALLDAGKRDLPFDVGLPVPQRTMGAGPDACPADLTKAAVTALDTQHAFLRLPTGVADAVPLGTVVRLGLSDPCTAFDKWRLIPVIDDADEARPRIVDMVHTFF